MKIHIYGITGKAGSGKSTFAGFLAKQVRDSHIIPFAKPLKDFAFEMGWNGKKDEKGRKLLQLLGTECGRECIGENVWVHHWLNTVEKVSTENSPLLIIADDVRFDNEAMIIKELGGTIIKIVGRNASVSEHSSEDGISNELVDNRIVNDCSIKKLHEEAGGYGNIIRNVR